MKARTGKWAMVPLGAAALVLLVAAAEKPAATSDGYDVSGKYYETCGCTVSCPCGTNKFLPTEGHCDAMSLFHIDKGTAEGVPMDGLNIAVVIKSPQGQKVMDAFGKGEMDLLSVYLDDKANEKQREAMPRLLGALFGTTPVKGSHPPAWVPMSIDVKGDGAKIQIAGGSKLSADIENVDLGGETKWTKKGQKAKRVTLTNVAPFPWVGNITQGFSNSFKYDDYGSKWEYKDRNAFFGTFRTKGKLPAEKPAPGKA